jgi:hypothetical protein
MTIEEANVEFSGKRVAVRNESGEWYAGLLAYVTTNQFPSWGTIAYYGRTPVQNINLDSMFEYQDALSLIEGKENLTP